MRLYVVAFIMIFDLLLFPVKCLSTYSGLRAYHLCSYIYHNESQIRPIYHVAAIYLAFIY